MAKKRYTYELETTAPIFPRHMADMLHNKWFDTHLVSIKDCQRDDHFYGSTYTVNEPPPKESMTYGKMLDFYAQQYESTGSTTNREAMDWILHTLEMDWVPGNMGMVYTYVGEVIEALQQFQAKCERVGAFIEEEAKG